MAEYIHIFLTSFFVWFIINLSVMTIWMFRVTGKIDKIETVLRNNGIKI